MRIWTIAFIVASVAANPHEAFGQAIAGTVNDSSGAALPDVVVQVESAALIEKVRTAVTDGIGRTHRTLRPGDYTVTFVREGFTSQRRAGIEIAGAFTATVDAQLPVGALSQTITVAANTTVVDVHSASTESTLGGDLVKSLPTVRSYNALVVLVPGVVTSANDVVTGTSTVSFPIHGGRSNEGRFSLDGLTVGGPSVGNSATSYIIDAGAAEEVTFTSAGGLGETETGGLVMNIVPKTGGNSMHGSLFASG